MPSITSEATFDLGGLADPLRFCGLPRPEPQRARSAHPRRAAARRRPRAPQRRPRAVRRAEDVLAAMLAAARAGAQVTPDDVALAARGQPASAASRRRWRRPRAAARSGRKPTASARSSRAIDANTLSFAIGPAGTGKTFLAIVMAVRALKNREVSRIVLSRPAVEAGEKLGFLPGDLKEKVDPVPAPALRRAARAARGRHDRRSISSAARSRSRRWRTCAGARSAMRS